MMIESSANPAPDARIESNASGSDCALLFAWMIAVAAAVFVVHWPAIHSPVITFDDEQYLIDNILVQHPGWASARQFLTEVLHPSTVHGYYQPLAMISLMIDWALGGSIDQLETFHVTSVLLHCLNTCLLVLLLYRLFGRIGAAALAGLLFGLHPLAIETIPWIAERKTLLASFFALASLNAYVRYARRPRGSTYIWSAALFVLAMLSKPTTIPLPAVMLLLDFWPLRRAGRRAILEKIPLFSLSILFAIITYYSQRNTATVVLPTQRGPLFIPYALCHNIVFYLFNFVCPTRLTWHYPIPRPFNWSLGWVQAGVIGSAILLSSLAVSLRWTRAFSVSWLIFFVAIFPTMGIIGFAPDIAADRHMYLPMIGFFMLLAWMMGEAADRAGPRRRVVVLAGVPATLAIAACLAVLTRQYYTHWQDNIGFRQYLLARAPGDWPIRNGLAMAYARAGRLDEALAEFTAAARDGAPDTFALVNWGIVLQKRGRFEDAIDRYQRALKLDTALPEAHNNLGEAMRQTGRPDEALRHFQEALRIKPRFAEAYCNLGSLYKQQGRFAEAIDAYRRGLELKPYLESAASNLASVQRQAGDPAAAERTLRGLVRARPGSAEAHSDLGALLRELGKSAEGLAEVRKALALNPQCVSAHYHLSNFQLDARQQDQALESLRAALRLDPRFVDARVNLANVLAAGGRADEAIVEYQTALRDEPDRASVYNNLAALLEEQGKLDEAERNYRRAIELDAKYADPHYNYAGLLVRLNRLDAALAELESAIVLSPRNVPALFLRGNILAHLGKTEKAVQAYDSVLAIDPQHEEARQQREGLSATVPAR